MRYPNLTAEYEAGCRQLWVYANHANVTQDLMQDILYADEEISFSEMTGLCRLLSQYGKCLSLRYLFSPVLSTINPATKKGKARKVSLQAKLTSACTCECNDILDKWAIRDAEAIIEHMRNGNAITYAKYRQATGWLDRVIQKPTVRRGRATA